MDFNKRLEIIKALNGVSDSQGQQPADDNETYAIFTTGDYADQEFKRIPKPSYGQRKKVEQVRLKAFSVPQKVKEAICEELGWDEKKIKDELSMIEYHEKVLPLITREKLPDSWDIEDVNSYEVTRMLQDFLLGT